MATGIRSPQNVSRNELSRTIKEVGTSIGFDAIGICNLEPITHGALGRWLAEGYAANMGYMGRQARRRDQPSDIVRGATRAIVTLSTYYQTDGRPQPGARVARYAWGEDYHEVIGARLEALRERLCELGATPESTRAYVDAGPVPERELARRAGLGWLAKNTMLINPSIGSYTFIGSVLTDLPLECDTPFPTDHCGSCRACLDACPTEAFPSERVVDSRRCISYLTIEHRGDFDADQGSAIGDWLFGCDVCQEVCPWNDKFARPTREPRFNPRPKLSNPSVKELAAIDEDRFASTYKETAFERTRAEGLRRNAVAILANKTRG